MSNMKAGKLMREGEKQMKKSKKCIGVAAVFFLALVMAVQVKAAGKFVPEKTQKYLFKTALYNEN